MSYTTGVVTTTDLEARQTYDKPRSVKKSTRHIKKHGNPKALPKRTKRKGS